MRHTHGVIAKIKAALSGLLCDDMPYKQISCRDCEAVIGYEQQGMCGGIGDAHPRGPGSYLCCDCKNKMFDGATTAVDRIACGQGVLTDDKVKN